MKALGGDIVSVAPKRPLYMHQKLGPLLVAIVDHGGGRS